MDELLNKLPTKTDVTNFVSIIDLMLESLYNVKNNKLENILKKSLSVKTAETFKKIFLQYGNDKEKIRNFLTELKAKLQNFKTLKLTLAIEPSKETLERINNWVRLNMGNGIIPEIEQDPRIIGGAIIEIDGIYKDYSLKKRLDEAFEKRKTEIAKLLYC